MIDVPRFGLGCAPLGNLFREYSEVADVLMVANRYTLLDQSAVPELVDACEVHGVRIVAAAVFNSGLLASTPSRDAKSQ